ncbi:hypothetical protein B0H17DRAFT_1131703 [Mycena rosella]|uniref:Uncharacterized protein n=1 Tax=Mycena rosella TaxID=1033263 RepID=A0AAD7DMG0_MYCRO|nr:hypothetical protein B0H17DRAFT_1131703 [Mycena rosella]
MSDIVMQRQSFKDACTTVGSILGRKDSWIAHLIGGQVACVHASAEAKADAAAQHSAASKKRDELDTSGAAAAPQKKQQKDPNQPSLTGFRRNDMPYGPAEKDVLQRQVLRAIVSGGLPLGAFEEHEMKVLIGMFRTTAPAILQGEHCTHLARCGHTYMQLLLGDPWLGLIGILNALLYLPTLS